MGTTAMGDDENTGLIDAAKQSAANTQISNMDETEKECVEVYKVAVKHKKPRYQALRGSVESIISGIECLCCGMPRDASDDARRSLTADFDVMRDEIAKQESEEYLDQMALGFFKED